MRKSATAKMPRNVLFLGQSSWGGHGGIQRFNLRVADSLIDACEFSKVVMARDPNNQKSNVKKGQRRIGCNDSLLLFIIQSLRNIFVSDLILLGHINLLPLAVVSKIFRPRRRVLLFAHGIEVWNDPRYRRRRFYESTIIRLAISKIAVVSEFSRDQMTKQFQLKKELFALFPNAVDNPAYQPRGKRPATILVVSRLGAGEAEKNVDKVIRALPLIKSRSGPVKLVIVGDGELRPYLEDLVVELDLSDNVIFLGFVNEETLNRAYYSSSIFVLPSSKEGFGIVFLEAWSRGLPVIASRFGGGGEVVSNGMDGFTVDPLDVVALASRIAELLNDERLCAKFVEFGQKKINDRYSGAAFSARLRRICRGDYLTESENGCLGGGLND